MKDCRLVEMPDHRLICVLDLDSSVPSHICKFGTSTTDGIRVEKAFPNAEPAITDDMMSRALEAEHEHRNANPGDRVRAMLKAALA